MARSANQKLKLLYLLKILTEQSDEEHCLSAQELIKALETISHSLSISGTISFSSRPKRAAVIIWPGESLNWRS